MTIDKLQEHAFAEPQQAACAMAACVGDQLRLALGRQDRAVLVLSGGRSPVPFLEALRTQPLDWARVVVSLVDERCVPEFHADSNARLVREHLLADQAQAARFVSWLPGIDDPQTQAPQALTALALQQWQGLPTARDVAVLGMGDDGHTASWFPDSEGLDQALTGTQELTWVRPRHAPHLRLTLTLQALQRFRHLHLSIAGAAKLQRYLQARQSVGTALPVSIALAHTACADVWIAR